MPNYTVQVLTVADVKALIEKYASDAARWLEVVGAEETARDAASHLAYWRTVLSVKLGQAAA